MADTTFMEKLVSLCKRRGFIFQSSEIYGGIGGFWDYGPLGVELKRNIKDAWWRDMVTNPPAGPDGRQVEMVGLDCAIIMNPKVWEASGHATGFKDPMVSCKAEGCKKLFRADKVFAIAFFDTAKHRQSRSELAQSLASATETGALDPLIDYPPPDLYFSVEADSWEEAIGCPAETFARDIRKLVKEEWTRTAIPVTAPVMRRFPPARCPVCRTGELTEPRAFNLMFESHAGALQDAASKVYLRPETAQGIFVNFKNVLDTARVKLPFGIAQVGKAFRNEINPRNYTFRSREFEQMEIEFFCREEDSLAWYEFWRNVRYNWYVNLGLKSEKLRLREQGSDELAHYSKACADIEYLFPFSDEFQELEGCAHRGCFDLTQHQQHSGKDMSYFDDEAWQRDAEKFKHDKDAARAAKEKPPYRFLPTVIEPSAGADRATLAFLCEAYTEDQKPDAKGVMQTRVYMRFHPRLAPIKAAFFPLVNREGMPELAEKLFRQARKHLNVFYDDGGSIGRRYARMDEAGTPYCITIDGDTVKPEGENAGTVTIRDRDTLEQIRVPAERVAAWLRERLES